MSTPRLAAPPLLARRLEAVLTVDGPAAGRHEWYLRQLPAVAADHVVHDAARAPRAVLLPPSVAALDAAARLVLQPPRLVELLLACGEYEVPATVTANEHLVHVVQHLPLLGRWLTGGRMGKPGGPARRGAILYPLDALNWSSWCPVCGLTCRPAADRASKARDREGLRRCPQDRHKSAAV